jgi:hypothetical protein
MCLPDLQYDHTLEISSTFPSPSTSSAGSMNSGPAIRPTSRVLPTVGGGVSGQPRRMQRRADCHSATVTRLWSIMSARFRLGGHTVGTHTVVVDTPSATVVLASDAVHYLEEWRRICRLRWWDLPATYVAFDTLNELGAKGAREAGVIMSGRLKHLPRTDSWGAVTDLLDAR